MSLSVQFYVSSIAILLLINLIAVWGLDLQYGHGGIFNFAFIVFQAAGAYAYGIFALHPASYYQAAFTYIGGFNWPFPLPFLAAAAVGALLAIPIGWLAVRRLRGDYQAMALLILSLIATGFADAQLNFVNGPTGLAFIPKPLQSVLPLTSIGYQWVYLAFVAAIALAVFYVVWAIVSSPFGRLLHAVRDSETAVASLGREVFRTRMIAFVIGGALGGLSGGLLVAYLTAWAPASWLYPETFLFFTAIVVGGTGNLFGNFLGCLLVPGLIIEGTRFLPQFGYSGLVDSLDWVVIGLVMLAFLYFRPNGLVPERTTKWVRLVPSGRRSAMMAEVDDAVASAPVTALGGVPAGRPR